MDQRINFIQILVRRLYENLSLNVFFWFRSTKKYKRIWWTDWTVFTGEYLPLRPANYDVHEMYMTINPLTGTNLYNNGRIERVVKSPFRPSRQKNYVVNFNHHHHHSRLMILYEITFWSMLIYVRMCSCCKSHLDLADARSLNCERVVSFDASTLNNHTKIVITTHVQVWAHIVFRSIRQHR